MRDLIQKAVAFQGHHCPRLEIGLRAAAIAMREFDGRARHMFVGREPPRAGDRLGTVSASSAIPYSVFEVLLTARTPHAEIRLEMNGREPGMQRQISPDFGIIEAL